MNTSVTEIGRFRIVKLSGRIDWENARVLDNQIRKLVEEGCRSIVFNLDEVTFICSGGVGAFIFNLNKLRKENGSMYIISSSDYVNYIFETLRFDTVFEGYLFQSFEDFSREVLDREPT